jgi:hypothetical protein
VRGRAGVGRRTVASALTGAGVTVVDEGSADVQVVVIAEAPKPEDRAMLADAVAPTLVVLNKADLSGFGAGGPVAVADRRAAEYRALTGVATVPMVGLLAVASLDDELVAALRVLTTEAADLTCTDAFLTTDHPVARPVRARLLDTLDLFGIAHCVVALRRGVEQESLPALLQRLSLLDRVVAQLAAISAEVRYRRVRSAVARLRTMAPCGPPSLADFLAGDDAVIAVMAAAVDVMRAAGLEVDPDDGPPEYLSRAVRWQRYGRGPVNQLHRSCAADISRGSLRLLRRAQAGTVTR